MTPHDLTLWRVRLGLTQAQAAERLGRHWTMISRYETGRIDIPRSIELLCEAIEAAQSTQHAQKTKPRPK